MSRKCFHLAVHADVVALVVSIVSSHEKTVVLANPSAWARNVSRYHHGCGAHLHTAHCARDVSVLDVVFSSIQGVDTLVLGAIDMCTAGIAHVRNVLWIKRQAEMVSASSFVIKRRPGHRSFVDEGSCRWTGIVAQRVYVVPENQESKVIQSL